MYIISYYVQFFCTVFCFSIAIIGVLNDDNIRVYDNNLHKLLFSLQLTACFVSIFIYCLSKLKKNKTPRFYAATIEKQLLLDHKTEINEADVRNKNRSRTESVVQQINKKFLSENMSKTSRQMILDLNKILNELILRCDNMIKNANEPDDKISIGTLMNLFMFLKTKIVRLNTAFEKMLQTGKLEQMTLWAEIDLDELALDTQIDVIDNNEQ
jgi:hypothetical protein